MRVGCVYTVGLGSVGGDRLVQQGGSLETVEQASCLLAVETIAQCTT